jgi:hypothetical protein
MYRLRQVNFDLAIQRSSRTRDFNRNAPNGEDFEMKTYLAVSFGTLAGMAIGGFAVPGRRASATSPAVGTPTEALNLAQIALSIHDKVLGQNHDWTKDSARATADALDALGRAEEAKVLRERYGVAGRLIGLRAPLMKALAELGGQRRRLGCARS